MENHRLDACGWNSFDLGLFLNEPGRRDRDVGQEFIRLLGDHSPGREVLELCCGAGGLSIALARAGYRVTGVDLSPDILTAFDQALAAEGPEVRERVTPVQDDICTFNLGRTFDFIILEDDSFVYLQTTDDQLACLRRVREHLSPEGRFFLRFTTPQRELEANEDFDYDPIRQVKTVRCRWTQVDAQGNEQVVQRGIERRRLTWPCELELLLRTAGLEVLHRWGGLDYVPLTDPQFQEYNYLMRAASALA